ncbi:MAG: DUF998 domain-containing protein [Candidatus Micrarchaeota archaeon]|nr:DUF998 domain-containing protein [Candidatus Micrarchaeota archaeon]
MATKPYDVSSHKDTIALRNKTHVSDLIRKENKSTDSCIEDKSGHVKKFYGMAGMLGPAIGWVSLYVATRNYAGFSWKTQAVSDFFSTRADGVLTAGLFASGILTSASAYGLGKKYSDSNTLRAGAILLGIGGASLAAVSISHGDLSFMHVPAATGYFAATSASLIILGTGFLKDGYKKAIGAVTVSAGLASLAILSTRVYPGIAIKETLSSVLYGSWVFGAGAGMLFSSTRKKEADTA